MAWVLAEPEHKGWRLFGSEVRRDSTICPHNRRHWNVVFWSCSDCGWRLRDTEEKTQETFDYERLSAPESHAVDTLPPLTVVTLDESYWNYKIGMAE